jgi:hypothetical protein
MTCIRILPVVLLCAFVAASGAGGADADSEAEFVPIEDVRPGDRCVGKTVFAGTDVEEFDVEILAVVRGTGPRSDLIIGRANGGVLDLAGIPQGMSGSPVYRDGRLIGAISSTWPFSKEPIAGITPIGEMLAALEGERSSSGRPGGALGLALVPPDERETCRLTRLWELAGLEPCAPSPPMGAADATYGGREMVPIALPLVVSGGSDLLLQKVAGVLGDGGLMPVRGAGGDAAGANAEPVPGSAVGVQFVGGDASWAAIGTLTHREGDHVVAFGHPIFDAGAVELPLVTARVHTVLPLASLSFKYASGGEVIGSVYSDRHRGVGGLIGPAPATIPLEVDVESQGGAASHYEFDVITTRPYGSIFAGLAASGAISEAALTSGHSLVEMLVTLETDGDPVRYEALFQTPEPALRTGGELAMLIDVVVGNGFERMDIRRASLRVSVSEGELWTGIESVSVARAVYAPGDDVELRVRLRDRLGEARVQTMILTVPPSAADGALIVRVGGAAAFHEWDAERLAGGLRPRTYEQLRRLIESSLPGNVVVAQLLSDRPGLSLSGDEIRRFPGRAALVMGSASQSGGAIPTDLTVLSEAKFEVDREVRGYHEFALFVRADR